MALVQIRGQDGNWVTMQNAGGAADWQIPDSPAPPIDVRVQLDDGEEVIQFFCCTHACLLQRYQLIDMIFISD